MRVKRYLVDSLPEAIPLIRNDLGKDAVILNTKDIRVGGFIGMFQKRKIEVIAAVEEGAGGSAAAMQQPKKPASAPPVTQGNAQQLVMAAVEAMGRGNAATASAAAASASVSVSPSPAAEEKPSAAQPVPLEQAAALTKRPLREPDPSQGQQAELMTELRDLKQWVVKLAKQSSEEQLPAALAKLAARLSEQEVEGELVQKLIEAVKHQLSLVEEGCTAAQVWEAAKDILEQWLAPSVGHVLEGATKVVHFVGPTGVGKTTTIAKLAAEQTIKHSKRVGFITSDTYRIAAVDQLRTYANILNVPLEVVFSSSDLTRAYTQLQACELVFMDTAGRNFRSELHVSEVISLLHTSERSETYLVLSLTSKYTDMVAIAERFSKYGVERVVFTKQDETTVYGTILNLILLHGWKASYWTSGQTVPDDLSHFRSQDYIQLLLGESEDE
ncbi:flagellar biosynthesis protein FlhF [Paenibacillus sp. GCM10023252]|uniref:flagellar biosynthesis protein FlhF n=1 Tax=Paenibacillus sp. GCM10023252 TaxID=3252649 RepID=UPI0036177B5F